MPNSFIDKKNCSDGLENMLLEAFWGMSANVLMMVLGVSESIPLVGSFCSNSVPYIKRIFSNIE